MVHRKAFAWITLFSMLIAAMALMPTFFMLEVYGRVTTTRNLTTLAMLLCITVLAFGVMALLDLARMQVLAGISRWLDQRLSRRLHDAILQARVHGGPTTNGQAMVDLNAVRDGLTSPGLTAVFDTCGIPLLLVVLFVLSPWLGAIAVAGVIIEAALARQAVRRTYPLLARANRSAIDGMNYAAGLMRQTDTLTALGAMTQGRARWRARNDECLRQQSEASAGMALTSANARFFNVLQGSLMLGAACWAALGDHIVGGEAMLIVASTLGSRVLGPLTQVVTHWRVLAHARDAAQRLDGVLSRLPAETPVMSLPPPRGALRMDGVTAAPPGLADPVIRGVKLAVLPGEVMGLIGASGAGKSSLARVAIGLWPVVTGTVRIDGADVFHWNREELAPHIGYLPQNPELLDGSLAENITRFGPVDPEALDRAIGLCGLQALVADLPDGLQTRLGDGTTVLSGGMRQRVALARAVYGPPQLVVLDEPEVNLDQGGLERLSDCMAVLRASGAAVVLITHHKRLLDSADRLALMHEGSVVMTGPRDEVLARLSAAGSAQPQDASKAPPRAIAS